jgi:NAD(P)-dependent dehydrogenase (short-subunit alcohol dehydrogenase family)
MARLKDKVALITGGYGGMGRASAQLFAEEGATVFIAGRSAERGEALAKEIDDAGGKAFFVELDVVKQDQWDAAVRTAKEKVGGLHILIIL